MTHAEYLKLIDEVNEKGPYKADWHSLSNHKTPDWYYRDKFGIFIHWGIYSVPAFSCEWYSRNMYDPAFPDYDYHVKNFGPVTDFGYKDFIPMFKGENFDASKWVKLFKEAGAKFIMPVCEHHDGFAMYETDFNKWNAKAMGPKRDVVKEIKEACEKENLTFTASTHRAEHYFFMNMGRSIPSDVQDDTYRDFYGPAVLVPELSGDKLHKETADAFSKARPTEEWLEDWLVRTCELIDKYKPAILYFDWWIHNVAFKPYLKKLCAYYYNRAREWGKEVTINYKHEAFPAGVATFDVERGALTGISPIPWQTDTAIGKRSWGYIKDNEFKPARQIICDLIDIVSKNGMLLLNVGPDSKGRITPEETRVLKEIGEWMRDNSEGIYGTTFWKTFGEGDTNNEAGFFMDNEEKPYKATDYRFTYKNGYLYAFCMHPEGASFTIKSLAQTGVHDFGIGEVTALGDYKLKSLERTNHGLNITLKDAPKTDKPVCFRVEIL